jgi:hypothetical protein
MMELDGESHHCQTVNISATGILILPPSYVEGHLGMHLSIRLSVPGRAEPLAIAGEVAREGSHRGHYALGIEFGSLPLKVLGDLMAFLHRLSRSMDVGRRRRYSLRNTTTETQRGWVGQPTVRLAPLDIDAFEETDGGSQR